MTPPLILQRGAEHLIALGPRGLAEFLHELGEATRTEAAIAEHLARWRRLDPAMLHSVLSLHTAGRQFPPALIPVERAA
ncbi:hypothetical protein KPL78_07195 [Roseomonas sp. HJA6]|uniref:Uncharacterized protein n=1 Tax=Roseomonas alba TaxID=2846776 RepID=A0ABS7A5Q5_9PROT|nr:hypothetical protein [Neoroseomonas alba]MBW6397623.1 hypothetical protein [Neoroseomonas alba]